MCENPINHVYRDILNIKLPQLTQPINSFYLQINSKNATNNQVLQCFNQNYQFVELRDYLYLPAYWTNCRDTAGINFTKFNSMLLLCPNKFYMNRNEMQCALQQLSIQNRMLIDVLCYWIWTTIAIAIKSRWIVFYHFEHVTQSIDEATVLSLFRNSATKPTKELEFS